MKTLSIICLFFVSTMLFGQNSQWTAPNQANSIENPVTRTNQVITSSKKLYVQYCALCHGDKGKGDGIAGVALQPKPADFTKFIFTQQTDGAIFWKITTGKAPMAVYKGIISDDQIWGIIHYIRSLSKPSTK